MTDSGQSPTKEHRAPKPQAGWAAQGNTRVAAHATRHTPRQGPPAPLRPRSHWVSSSISTYWRAIENHHLLTLGLTGH